MIRPSGPDTARIMIVFDGPTKGEALAGQLMIGVSGKEFSKMLHEAGILITECYITSVAREWVPEHKPFKDFPKYFSKYTKSLQIPVPAFTKGHDTLLEEIAQVNPNIIITCGEAALWALGKATGITKFRGSILEVIYGDGEPQKFLPIYSPAIIQRKWDWRSITVHDLKRAKKESLFPEVGMPDYQFKVRPKFDEVCVVLDALAVWATVGTPPASLGLTGTNAKIITLPRQNGSPLPPKLLLSGDIETRFGFSSCFGIGWSTLHAICIPWMSVTNDAGYWTVAEETEIVAKTMTLFKHPNIEWTYQNGIYDFQYHAAEWGCVPTLGMDTMHAHHTCWSGLLKGLDYLSSLYCEFHRYWKDDGKEFHDSVKSPADEDKYWGYNCKDSVVTYECVAPLDATITKENQRAPYQFQQRQFKAVLRMMLRGVRIDQQLKSQMALPLLDAIAEREAWLHDVLGAPLNPKSPKQMQKFFYDTLGLPRQRNRKTRGLTTDAGALDTLTKLEPLIAPVTQCILELRSLGVFLSTFVRAELSSDQRMRSSYNIAGTETFRWSSSKDAFHTGMNLQNIPKGNEK